MNQLKKSKAPTTLAALASQVRAGDVANLPEEVILNLSTVTLEEYEVLLELVRHKSYGARALKTVPQLVGIQSVRAMIQNGNLDQALSSLTEMDNSACEVKIEIARCHVFQGCFDNIETLLKPVTEDLHTPATDRGVANQLIGHAMLERGDLKNSQKYLERALEISYYCGNTFGIISNKMFLSRICFFNEDFNTAEHHLVKILDEINKLGSLKWYLGYYRNLSHFYFMKSDAKCIDYGRAAQKIAQTLGDSLFFFRGNVEMAFMKKHFGLPASIGPEAISFSQNSTSDLKDWIRAFSGDPSNSYSVSNFQRLANSLCEKPVDQKHEAPIAWLYDRKSGIVIDLTDSTITNLPVTSPIVKILNAIGDGGKLTNADLFEKAWGLKWNSDRHQNILDVAFHRFNKTMKNIKTIREDGEVRLSYSGLSI